MLYPLELQSLLNKQNKLWFDENGLSFYGPDEENLLYARGNPSSLVTSDPPYICVVDLEKAFKLGMKVGQEKRSHLEAMIEEMIEQQ